jgi:hypothetical protein
MLVLAVALGAGTVAADPPAQLEADDAIAQLDETQEAADSLNETEDQENELVYQFDNGGELVNVRFEENIAYVTLRATNTPRRFWLSEAAMEGSGSFSFKNVRVLPGEPVTVKMPVETNAITVTSGNDGYYYEGDIGLTVITSTPTTELVQISAISGIIGSVIALAIVIGQLRRKHENSYKELFSDERHEIQSEPIEGYYEQAVDAVKRVKGNRLTTTTVALLGFYSVGVLTGRVMGPGAAWLAMGDTQRLLVVGSAAATLVALLPVYWLVKKIWNPNREFVLDLDSRDVYRSYNGDQSGGVAAYSAPPSRINDLEVDGSVTTMSTPGGHCHLVRGFDPEENEAEANPPELADDREVAIEVSKIDHNRQILTDLATIGRDLIGAMSAFRVTADAAAMKDIDDGIRNTVSAGTDSMEDVLSDAVAGTRYEGTYQPDGDTDDLSQPTTDSSTDSTDQDDTVSTTDQQPADTDGGSDT